MSEYIRLYPTVFQVIVEENLIGHMAMVYSGQSIQIKMVSMNPIKTAHGFLRDTSISNSLT